MHSRLVCRFHCGLAAGMLLAMALGETSLAQSPGPGALPFGPGSADMQQPAAGAPNPAASPLQPGLAPSVTIQPSVSTISDAPSFDAAPAGPWMMAAQPPSGLAAPAGTPTLAAPAPAPSAAPFAAPPSGQAPASPQGPLPPPEAGQPSTESVVPPGAAAANLTPEQVQQIVADYLRNQQTGGDYQIGTDLWLRPRWENGLVFESPNGDFTFHFGGRLQLDTTAFSDSQPVVDDPFIGGTGPIENSTYIRRARLRADGTAWDLIDWVIEYEFANTVYAGVPWNPPGSPPIAAVPSPTDVYVRFKQIPMLGNFQIGNFKEPIGFEHLVNDSWTTFMERSFNFNVFYGPFNNGYSPGMMITDTLAGERATYAAWFGPNSNNYFGYQIGGQFAGTLRTTYLPYYDADGRYLVHVGSSVSYRSPDQGQFRARALPNIFSGPYGPAQPILADTGSVQANSQSLLNLEFASVWGPLTLQAEYTIEWVTGAALNPYAYYYYPAQQAGLLSGSTLVLQGGYIEAAWFFTGEHRAYNRKSAVFERVVPHENFYLTRGPNNCSIFGRGAWQGAIRFSSVDLNSRGLNGGKLTALTLGVNWYLNPNMKFQFNYDCTWRGQVAEVGPQTIEGVGARFSLDF